MKFSILISSFNKGKYLDKCITSCINQHEKDYEIILFDNYSTDNTFKVLKKFQKKLKYFKKKKVSKSPALNQLDLIKSAFKKSKGDFICLLDADDYFSENKLSTLRKFFFKKKLIQYLIYLLKFMHHRKKNLKIKKSYKEIFGHQ